MDHLLNIIETQTGFHTYGSENNCQTVFYGTSDKFDLFKDIVGSAFATGTKVYLMDTKESFMYSGLTGTWY